MAIYFYYWYLRWVSSTLVWPQTQFIAKDDLEFLAGITCIWLCLGLGIRTPLLQSGTLPTEILIHPLAVHCLVIYHWNRKAVVHLSVYLWRLFPMLFFNKRLGFGVSLCGPRACIASSSSLLSDEVIVCTTSDYHTCISYFDLCGLYLDLENYLFTFIPEIVNCHL